MKINITSGTPLSPLLGAYAEKKFSRLQKLVKHFEEESEVQVWLEIRQSNHHKKGDTFTAVVDAHLPKKILHAEAEGATIRTAIDEARDTLRSEIEKHKDKLLPKRGK
jgi:ribosomal subunit interface protein